MSFILDALKKSERERQRQTGPALFEVKVAPPRNRFPLWAVVIGALLVVNSGVIIWLLWHKSSQAETSQTADTTQVTPGTAPMGGAPNSWNARGPNGAGQPPGYPQYSGNTPYGANGPISGDPSQYAGGAQYPGSNSPYPGGAQYPGSNSPYPGGAQYPGNTSQYPGGSQYSSQYAGNAPYGANTNRPSSGGGGEYFGDPAGMSAQNQPTPAPDANNEPRLKQSTADDEVLNPDDYEPATEQPRSSRSASARKPRVEQSEPKSETKSEDSNDKPAERAARKAEKGLPTYQDAAAMPGMNMPPLRLDLHVYDPEPDKSFVLVNMQKVKSGDTIAQGVHVDQITPSGAIMTYRGVRFLLHSE
jgi:hypothetical protein